MISKWKRELLENIAAAFEKEDASEKQSVDTQEPYAQIGQLKVENGFLKKLCENGDMKTGQCSFSAIYSAKGCTVDDSLRKADR